MKKSVTFLSFLAIFFAFACSNKEPNNAETEESMTEILEEASDARIEEMNAAEEGSEREILASELPENVVVAFQAKYPDVTIKEVDEITDANGDIVYEIEFEKMDHEYEVIFDAFGKFVKQSMEDEEMN